ncbi:PLDc N-terminal domain-containing protein [uncultured Leifsonia sp.]|uniref:PLD nuclease N-terminal domain-containing protein n=1 Tax=Leifsonia sp. TaxID=1870902 RepID=UPI0028D6E0E1|nr:PLDc N-terminal domain-containing protein [uncultured Leifsonia sp.]
MVVIPALVFVLFVVALIDIILRTGDQIRHLPKVAWVFIVILLPLIGSILWFTVGREYYGMRSRPARPQRPAASAPGSSAPAPAPRLSSTEEQLAALEREIADDRIRRLEAELRKRRGEAEGA